MSSKIFIVDAGKVVKAVVGGVEKVFLGGEKFFAHEIGRTFEWVEKQLGHGVKAVEFVPQDVSVKVVDAVTGVEIPNPADSETPPQA